MSYEVQNLRGADWESKFNWLLLEAVPAGHKTRIKLKIQEELLRYARQNPESEHLKLPPDTLETLSSLPDLFKLINAHTKNLVGPEKKWLEGKKIESKYTDFLQKIYNRVSNPEPQECILRLGFGVGWTFMTGNWLKEENTPDPVWNEFKNGIRNERYQGTPFPKTRRFDYEGRSLGFVKLRILD